MDREKQDMPEESSGSEAKLNNQTIASTINKKTKKLLNTNDDDTTSTESSDTFETWTILFDKEKPKTEDNVEERIEILKKGDHKEEEEEGKEVVEKEKEKEKNKSFEETENQDSFNDDLSDGISIISESESVGRISPHPYVRDHLHDLNLKFCLSDHMDDSILNRIREEMENETVPLIVQGTTSEDQHLRQRLKSSSDTLEDHNQALQKASQTTCIVPVNNTFPLLVRKGIQSIFFVAVALAILALIGKIVNPTWQPLTNVGYAAKNAELEQKLNDMELQNNLMRAEIDLLNKQVQYLNTLNDPHQQKPQQSKYKDKDYKDSRTFKAWSGNGDTLKPVDITKQDLRTPYKCPDGSFVEIANMCLERGTKDEPALVDQFGKVVEDLKEQSELFKTFENVAEELQGFQDNPFEQLHSQDDGHHEFIKNKPIYQPPEDLKQKLPLKEKYQKHRPKGEDFQSSASYKQYKHGKYEDVSKSNKEYKNSFTKEFSTDSKEFKMRPNSKERGEWKTDKFNNSKERKYRKDNNSKEHFNKQYVMDDDDSHENSKENHSKERYNNNMNHKQKRKYNKNGSNEDFSGEWQTNYMKHRENLRKNNEQKYPDNKNWYIKRADSREYKRSGEKQFR